MPTQDETAQDRAATKKNFVAALLLHVMVVGGLLGSAFLFHQHGESWGEKTDLAGAVQATMVNSIPLPPRVEPKQENVLASESPSPGAPAPNSKG